MGNSTDNTKRFEDIKFAKLLKIWSSPFLKELEEMFVEARDLLARIPEIFPNYTLHDINHTIRVADYMYDLVKDKINRTKQKSQISELDVVIMLHSALLHDIGMFVSDEDKELINKDEYQTDGKYNFQLSGMKNIGFDDPKMAFQEFVRRIHGYRSRKYIQNKSKEKNKGKDKGCFDIPNYPNLSFADELALICESHNENFDWIKKHLREVEEKGDYIYNPQFCACMLRLADILDIDSERTPPRLYELIRPKDKSNEEWLQHFTIHNSKKVVRNEENKQIRFRFVGECHDPYIHRKIYGYLDWVKDEVVGTRRLMRDFSQKYKIDFDIEQERKIEGKGYSIPDYKMTVNYKAVSTLLMGEQIYGDNKMGLRELVQNSMDACKLRAEIEQKRKKPEDEDYRPVIKIILDKEKNEVRIKDNGTGMDLDVIKNHFLSIGLSYYQSDKYKVQNFEYSPIGNFGIGFLACFMLSDVVKVRTKHYESNNLIELDIEKAEEYSCIKEREDYKFEGTEIILNYEQFFNEFTDGKEELHEFIDKYFLADKVNIELLEIEKGKTIGKDIFSKGIERFETPNDNDCHIINLSEYLIGIEGYIKMPKQHKFIFEDFNEMISSFKENVYFYQDGKFRQDFENYDINSLLNKKIINFFQASFRVHFDNDLYKTIPIKVIYNTDGLDNSINLIQNGFIEYLKTKETCNNIYMNHPNSRGICHCFLGSTKQIIPDDEFSSLSKRTNITFTEEEEEENIYLKDIYVYDYFYLGIENASTLPIISFYLNITQEGIFTTVSRDSLDSASEKETSYILYKLAHIFALENYSLNDNEKTILRAFIKEKYGRQTIFEKENLINRL